MLLQSSCKKEDDSTPRVPLTHANGTWEKKQGQQLEVRFQFTNSCNESLPQTGVTPDEQKIGLVEKWYENVIKVPLFPDIVERFKESGTFYVRYATTISGQTILEGEIDWNKKQRYVASNLTNIGGASGRKTTHLQWYNDDPDKVTFEGTTLVKKE